MLSIKLVLVLYGVKSEYKMNSDLGIIVVFH